MGGKGDRSIARWAAGAARTQVAPSNGRSALILIGKRPPKNVPNFIQLTIEDAIKTSQVESNVGAASEYVLGQHAYAMSGEGMPPSFTPNKGTSRPDRDLSAQASGPAERLYWHAKLPLTDRPRGRI
jgi:hypothetical protein